MFELAVALSVNLNKVALLRNSRPIGVPSVLRAGQIALEAGAHGLTVHPRPDGRHILPEDVPALAALVTSAPGREYNIEGNPFAGADVAGARAGYPGFVELVRRARDAGGVHQVTLVPDEPGQATSDHGWDLARWGRPLEPVVRQLRALGCRVSLFMDPVAAAMEAARSIGADRVELYTEPYARAFDRGQAEARLAAYAEAAAAAEAAGLEVNAGHDLNLDNLGLLLRRIPAIREVSIGHALTADALWLGLEQAVRAYLEVLAAARAA